MLKSMHRIAAQVAILAVFGFAQYRLQSAAHTVARNFPVAVVSAIEEWSSTPSVFLCGSALLSSVCSASVHMSASCQLGAAVAGEMNPRCSRPVCSLSLHSVCQTSLRTDNASLKVRFNRCTEKAAHTPALLPTEGSCPCPPRRPEPHRAQVQCSLILHKALHILLSLSPLGTIATFHIY